MDTLERQLTERMQNAVDTIDVPWTDTADDVRRGRTRLRRTRGAAVGGAALAMAAVVGGIAVASGGDGSRALDPAIPPMTARCPAGEGEPVPEDPSPRFTYTQPEVADALAAYDRAVLGCLDPQGEAGGPSLIAVPTDGFMNEEVEIEGRKVTFTMPPSSIDTDYELGSGDQSSTLSLTISDLTRQYERDPEALPPEEDWDCADEPGCTEVDLGVDQVERARYFERDGQLAGVHVRRTDGTTVSLWQTDEHGKEELPLPWTVEELFAVLLDPALVLPDVP